MAVPPDSVPVSVTRRVETGVSVGDSEMGTVGPSRIERLDFASNADVEDMPTIHGEESFGNVGEQL